MEESVDQFLERARTRGELDSEGGFRIDLAEAARKFAQFGQVREELWTLKLGQCFYSLGCGRLLIKPTRSRWVLEGLSSVRALDPVALQESLSRLGLADKPTAEDHLAMALSALSLGEAPMLGARWMGQESYCLLGAAPEVSVTPGDQTLVLQFAKGEAPRFPHELWSRRFCYSPLTISLKSRDRMIRLNDNTSTGFLRQGRPFQLEYLASGRLQQTIRLRPTGHTRFELGNPASSDQLDVSTRARWIGASPFRADSLIVLLGPSLERPARVYPLVGGCWLEPFETREFPSGFTVVLNAESCPTDIGQQRLREGQEFQALLLGCLRSLDDVIELCLEHLQQAPTESKQPSWIPLLALPVSTGLALIGELEVAALFALPGLNWLRLWLSHTTSNTHDLPSKLKARQEEILHKTPAPLRPSTNVISDDPLRQFSARVIAREEPPN